MPVTYEYVGQTAGLEGSRGAGAGHGHSREASLHRRRMGEGRTAAVPHRSESRCRRSRRPSKPRSSRARAQLAQSEREVARLKPLAESARRAEGSRRRPCRTPELARAAVKAAEARRRRSQSRVSATRESRRRSPASSSRANKSEGSLVTANDTLLTLLWQVDPIWVPFNVSENDRLVPRARRRRGQAHAARRTTPTT